MIRCDVAGLRFGRLLAIEPTDKRENRSVLWRCVCDCGQETLCTTSKLKNGNTKSCGCLVKDHIRSLPKHKKHGVTTNGKRPTEYSIWQSMKLRCYRPQHIGYHRYGGRGITVCERWRSDFAAFLSDMGPRPSPMHSLDRIDNDGPYSPENCRWATVEEQYQNKSTTVFVVINGERLILADAIRKYAKVKRGSVHARISRGWPIEKAILTGPVSPS